VIRFKCPLCGKVLKAAVEKAGRVVVCPRCDERSVVPASAGLRTGAAEDVGEGRPLARRAEGPSGVVAGMSRPMQWGVAVAASLGVCALLVPLLSLLWPSGDGPSGSIVPPWAVIAAPCSVAALLVLLYGKATACPRCRKWWARTKVGSEFVDREVFDKRGVPFAKSLYRTIYQCDVCHQRWSVVQADEYREPTQRVERPQRR
jgi:hypothetical protein